MAAISVADRDGADGRLEATDALRTGKVTATGDVNALIRIFHAIELLLDVSSRCPPLRTLADSFRDSGPPAPLRPTPEPSWAAERMVLARLGLLDDEAASRAQGR